MKSNSILRQLFYTFNAFGIFMGLVFPIFAEFFVEWKDGMYIWFSISCFFAGLAIGVSNYYIMKVVLLSKLQTLSQAAQQVGEKDLSARCTLQSEDFIGRLANNFNAMSSSLANSMSTINTLSHQVAFTSSQLLNDSKSTFELVHDQTQKIDNVTISIDMITESANIVSTQADQVAKLGTETIELSNDSQNCVVDTVSKIDLLDEKITSAQHIISNLAEDCNNIGAALSVIQSIAEQTNLLALNAAIEAARAGEVGRGFAVVADEVRNLATRTQVSTSEIESIISRLQTSSISAVKVIETSSQLSNETSTIATKTGDSVRKMQSSIQMINALNNDMNNNIQHQLNDVQSINDLIKDIRGQADSIDDTTKSNESSSQKLDKLSNDMNITVSSFKY
jgi:methyl-accepting chemotaxis protein